MINWQSAFTTLVNFPMGGRPFGRYYNGLIHGGATIFVLWLVGAIAI